MSPDPITQRHARILSTGRKRHYVERITFAHAGARIDCSCGWTLRCETREAESLYSKHVRSVEPDPEPTVEMNKPD